MLTICDFADNSGGYSGGGSGGFRDETRRGGFEEYNAGDDEISSTHQSNSVSQRATGNGVSNTNSPRRATHAAAPAPPKPKEPEVDLLGGFGDEDVIGGGTEVNVFATEKALPVLTSPPAFGVARPATATDGQFPIRDFAAAKLIYICNR